MYWALRADGLDARAAAERLERMPVAARHELLHARGTPFQELPAWQRRGVGLWSQTVRREGRDPRSGEVVELVRRELRIEPDLPLGDAYEALLRERIAEARSS